LLIPNLGLATAEGFVFSVFLLVLPKDPKNELILGFSSQRLLLLSGVFAISLLFFTFFIYFRHHSIKASKIDTWLLAQEYRIPILLTGYILLWLAIFVGLALFRPAVLLILKNSAYILRLIPFWGWSLLIPLQLACFWFYEWKWDNFTLPSYLTLAFFICTLALGLSVYRTTDSHGMNPCRWT